MTIPEVRDASSIYGVVDQLIHDRRRKRMAFMGFLIIAVVQLWADGSDFHRGLILTMMIAVVVDLLSVDRCLNVCRAVMRQEHLGKDSV